MTDSLDGDRVDPRNGWLLFAWPATATRFRVESPVLRRVVRRAGAEIVDRDPEVEIVTSRPRGDADCVIVPVISHRGRAHARRWQRAVQRAAASTHVTVVAQWHAWALQRAGYDIRCIRWTRGDPVTTVRRPAPSRDPNVVVVGTRAPSVAASIVDRSLASALGHAVDRTGAHPITCRIGSSGTAIVVVAEGVLRVQLAPSVLVDRQHELLQGLRVAPTSITARVPVVLAAGETGGAHWTLESRLAGATAPELSANTWRECVEFLAQLFLCGVANTLPVGGPVDDAAVVASVCNPDDAEQVMAIGHDTAARLASLPLGVAHGDFWAGNVLVERDHVVGVVDWPAGRAGALPILDVFHLWLSERRERSGARLGRAIIDDLFAFVERDDDSMLRGYCDRVSIDPSTNERVALVFAYWLQRIAQEINDPGESDAGPDDEAWYRDNIREMLAIAAARGFHSIDRPTG